MRFIFYFSGKLNWINEICIDSVIKFSEYMRFDKPIMFTHDVNRDDSFKNKVEYHSMDGLDYYFYADTGQGTLYEYSLKNKYWFRFSDLIGYFGSQILNERCFKVDTDIYIRDYVKMEELLESCKSVDTLFMDRDTRVDSNIQYLNIHMTCIEDPTLLKYIYDTINHQEYVRQNLTRYTYTGPHYMNKVLFPVLPKLFPEVVIMNAIPYNGYDKDKIKDFVKEKDISIFDPCTYVHLVTSQCTDWVNKDIVDYPDINK